MRRGDGVNGVATVFGGTGFLGRRIVSALARRGWRVRVVSRHPAEARDTASADLQEHFLADIGDPQAVAEAVDGVDAVANAVSLYVETNDLDFDAIHVRGARRVADAVARAKVARLVHLSGIGADPKSSSNYLRARGEGEEVVRRAFPSATLFRPSAMFGPDDALLTTLMTITRLLPVVPLFGRGETRLQPVSVDDVAEAAARVMTEKAKPPPLAELGGPDIMSYRDLVALVLRKTGRWRPLMPTPFFLWDALAAAARVLPSPPLTEGQVALIKRDNVADPSAPGLAALGVAPRAISEELDRRAERPA